MKKQRGFGLIGILLIIGALILTAGVVVWEKKTLPAPTPSPTEPPIAQPTDPAQPVSPQGTNIVIKVDKTKYQNNGLVFEPVEFTIVNNSGKAIYYLKGCAVQFPGACKIVGNDCQPLPGPKIVCEAEPSVAELGSGKTLHFYWNQIQGQNEFVPSGRYRLMLSYSFEGVPRSSSHTLGETTTIYSQPVTIDKIPLTRETTVSICRSWANEVNIGDLTYPADWCEMKLREKFGG